MKLKKFSTGMLIALALAACSENKTEKFSAADTTNDAPLPSDLSGSDAKLVKTADIEFEVKNAYKSCSNIAFNVRNLGGAVTHRDIKTTETASKTIPVSDDSVQVISSYRVEAEMTVRVPASALDQFVESVAANATVIYAAKVDVEDRSIDYLATKLKLQQRQKIADSELKKDNTNSDAMEMESSQDKAIDAAMLNLRTNANVRYSTINLRFSQNAFLKKETIPNPDMNAYEPGFGKRFPDALSAGFGILIDILIGLTHIWPLILTAIAGWFTYKLVIKKLRFKKEN